MRAATTSEDERRAHLGMAMVQLFNAGYHVITKVALDAGVNQVVFCVFRDLIALAILAPLAYFCEKRQRLPLNKHLLLTFCFLGFTGIFGNQLLFLLGLGYTNPSYASALQPAIPVFTFIFAMMMGTETVNIRTTEGQKKLGGTVISVSGALLMSIFRGPTVLGHKESNTEVISKISNKGLSESTAWLLSSFLELGIDKWHLGVLCLIGNCACMAAFLSVQAPLLVKYPASLSVTAYSYLFGVVCMVVTALFQRSELTAWSLTQSEVLAVCYAGVFTSAVNYGIVTWSNKILGPALVALYMPLQPALSAFLSRVFLGSSIYLGSILGGLLIIAGLYLVTWASHEERQKSNQIAHDCLAAEPLIGKDLSVEVPHQIGLILPGSSNSTRKLVD